MDNSFKSALIIDDDPTQIAILTAYFTTLNIPVIQSASNAALALSKVTEGGNDFDLIVSDLQMPEMDGLEFLRHLSSRKYGGSLVIMSGVEKTLLDHAAKLAKMHKLNLIGHIQKPLNKTSLEAVFLKEHFVIHEDCYGCCRLFIVIINKSISIFFALTLTYL